MLGSKRGILSIAIQDVGIERMLVSMDIRVSVDAQGRRAADLIGFGTASHGRLMPPRDIGESFEGTSLRTDLDPPPVQGLTLEALGIQTQRSRRLWALEVRLGLARQRRGR